MNYTRAAEELGLTQPAVSKHIKYLEENYNVKLFCYKNKRLTLTKEGEYLKNIMNAMNHDAIRVKEDIGKLGGRKHINLGATLSIGNFYLPTPLFELLRHHPELDVSVTIADTQELLSKLDRGELAFILCEGDFEKEKYSYKLLKNSDMVICCGSDYDGENIHKIDDIFSHRIILREKGSGTRDIFERYLNEHGYSTSSFERFCEVNNSVLIIRMLEENLGISVFYRDVGEEKLKNGKLKEIKLPNFHIEHEFNAVWAKDSIHGEEYERIIDELKI
jgi:DNA-binding transcriptional LysR family regulator